MGTNRWPKSLHSQAEALLGGVRAIGRKKGALDQRFIRGLGTWDVYRSDIHRFVEFLQRAGLRDLRQARSVSGFARAYIFSRGQTLRGAGGSFQTLEREISALTKLSHALDVYSERHGGESAAPIRTVLAEGKAHWRAELSARSIGYASRAYPDPEGLYAVISDPALRLQAKLMGETGCRTEGVGAPARGSNPLTASNLLGLGTGPVSGHAVGRIMVQEKGGKQTEHFVDPTTYSYSAWPTAGGDVVARLSSTHGMLVPSVDPLKPPFRAVGLLWENGDFARNSSSAILSFVNSAGVILAAAYPDALAERFVRRNDAAWASWLPAAPDEKAQRSSARMEAAFPKRQHVALTPELVLRFLGKNPGSEVLSLKPGPVLDTVIWKNGVSRSGKRVSAEHMFLRPFFERFMEPVSAE